MIGLCTPGFRGKLRIASRARGRVAAPHEYESRVLIKRLRLAVADVRGSLRIALCWRQASTAIARTARLR